jgi:hypothetical protein
LSIQKIQIRIRQRWSRNGSQGFQDKISAESSYHHYFAVREIDHAKNAIHECVPNGNQGIHAANDQTGNSKTNPGIQAVSLIHKKHVINAHGHPNNHNNTEDRPDDTGHKLRGLEGNA